MASNKYINQTNVLTLSHVHNSIAKHRSYDVSAAETRFEADPSVTRRTQEHATSFGGIPHLDISLPRTSSDEIVLCFPQSSSNEYVEFHVNIYKSAGPCLQGHTAAGIGSSLLFSRQQ